MEIEIIDTPLTVTVADIAPGKEFAYDGERYMRLHEDTHCNINCFRISDYRPCWVGQCLEVEPRATSTRA